MSFDDYANHIYQKHRLAVSLAIIKSKPTNLATDKYLEELKSKVDHKMDDDDITICSDDFLMEDDDEMNDSVTILKDFDTENVFDENVFKDFEVINDDNAATEKLHAIPENLSQITHYDSSQTQSALNIAEPEINESILCEENYNVNQNSDIEVSIPINVVKHKKRNYKIINSDHNTVNSEKSYKNNDFKVLGNETSNAEAVYATNHKHSDNKCIGNTDATYYDSQTTIPYTVHGFTQNYTHYSPSQNDIIIPNKYLYGVNRNVSTHNEDNTIASNTNTERKISQNITDFDKENQFVSECNSLHSKTYEKQTINKGFEYSQTMNMFSEHNDDNFGNIQNNNVHSNSENNITIIDMGKGEEIQNSVQYSQNIDEYFDNMQNVEDNAITNDYPTEKNIEINNNYPQIADTEMNVESLEYNQNLDCFSQNTSNKIELGKGKDISNPNKNHNTENLTHDSENENQRATVNSSDHNKSIQEYKITEEEYDSEEIVSYKVLEEFNKVKTFLSRQNRRMSSDGYSTDSGYRSDSQIRSSNRSALQLSGNWLNQSGCCLFTYIMQCPLVVGTRAITNEIAQVLGQLIDKLHEEEKYPSFLEDLLETVDLLLRKVYEGASSDSEFLKKDESIQRILLLNKSIHIQKHSIEKISDILETFHTKVTEIDSTYELSNIDQIENVSYIFHLLEILLKKYLKNKDLLSQSSTQISQEDDKVFKKSSIADIWRKKWNPSQKIFEGSREKKCVLKTCSDVLNKIVVDCVGSYSLIAYSALKCFNSMQS